MIIIKPILIYYLTQIYLLLNNTKIPSPPTFLKSSKSKTSGAIASEFRPKAERLIKTIFNNSNKRIISFSSNALS